MLRPGSLVSRVLALGVLGLAILGSAQLVVGPLIAAFGGNASAIEEAENLLQRYRALAEHRPALAEQLSRQERLVSSAAGYLQGPSDALAAAQLQDHVKSVIEGAAGQLHSIEVLPARAFEDDIGIRRAGVRIQFAATLVGLAETLYELESGQPYLLIERLSVREQRDRERHTGAPLSIIFELSGYVRA